MTLKKGEAGVFRVLLCVGLVLAALSCDDIVIGEEDRDAQAPGRPGDGEGLSWENFGQDFFASYCVRCHGTPPTNGAPFSLETYEEVFSQLERVRVRAVEIGDMPTSAPLPGEEDITDLAEWIDEGAPEK